MLRWMAGLAFLIWLASLGMGLPLIGPASPWGIISFELAGSTAAAAAMTKAWGEAGRLWAAFGLGWDYLFLLSYSTALALGCLRTGERLKGPAAGWAIPLAWGQWGAALLDAVENVALLRILAGSAVPVDGPLAFWCGAVKFGLVAAGLLYTGAGFVRRGV